MSINFPNSPEPEHTCNTQHPDDPTPCAVCMAEDPPMLVCRDCGEAFDSILVAYGHTFTNEDGLPESCGEEFYLLLQSEAM
jgi:hypothetical protein